MENKYLVGICEQMCPQSEIIFREQHGLVHVLECSDGVKRKADGNKMVKEFSRSAAGKREQKPDELRTVNALLSTVHYLLHDVVRVESVPWNVRYDFIMDRFRAVRQDIVVQSLDKSDTICILQPIVKFTAYASYRLCEESPGVFDPVMNKKHLSECLHRLLSLYDDSDTIVLKYFKYSKAQSAQLQNASFDKRRVFTECLHLIVNLGKVEAIQRGLRLKNIIQSKQLEFCLKLSVNYLNGNFIRVTRDIRKLSGILLCCAVLHLPQLQKKCLKVMSVAYNSKNLQFPTDALRELLLFKNNESVLDACRYYGMVVFNGVKFNKNNFDDRKKELPPKRFKFADESVDLSMFLNDES